MEIRTKCVNQPATDEDGYRVLVEREWPEGFSKQDLAFDVWATCLAPKPEVYEGLTGAPEDIPVFEERYRAELDTSPKASAYVNTLQSMAPNVVTLVHAQEDPAFDHASVLASWLREKCSFVNAPEGDRPTKTPAQSATESVHTVAHEHMNGEDRLFGGRLMEWIDDVAGVCARRHCGGTITTASVDTLLFLNPAFLNDIVSLKARVTYVGNTSLEVRVDSYVEDVASGKQRLINTAYLTEVFIGEDGRPTPVPWALRPTTVAESEEYEGAQRRIQIRKARAKAGY